jgi:predicted MFS family arabinose efflux permease
MTFQPMHRQVLLLATAQALFQTASVLVMTVGGLAGSQIAPAPHLATAPIASMLLGTVLATVPASIWMARAGRRTGFIAGALLGTSGGVIAAIGIVASSLPLLSLGTLLVGTYQGFAQYYRFAASEVANDAFRPRAISLVLAGGVVAAFLGPALGELGGPLLVPAYVGSFLILAAVSFVAAGLLFGLHVPMPRADVRQDSARPLLTVMRQPTYAVALFGAATGGGVMVLAMTAMPLAMAHHHHGLSETAMVMQAHVLGMFLPSFFTGSLIARFGVLRVMLAGTALLSAHVALALSGTGFVTFASALAVLGVGWNFLYVGGTTLLTGAYSPAEKGRAQAANDLTVFTVALLASLGAGMLLQTIGWRAMNAMLLPWLLAAATAILWLGRTRRPAPLPDATGALD